MMSLELYQKSMRVVPEIFLHTDTQRKPRPGDPAEEMLYGECVSKVTEGLRSELGENRWTT